MIYGVEDNLCGGEGEDLPKYYAWDKAIYGPEIL